MDQVETINYNVISKSIKFVLHLLVPKKLFHCYIAIMYIVFFFFFIDSTAIAKHTQFLLLIARTIARCGSLTVLMIIFAFDVWRRPV